LGKIKSKIPKQVRDDKVRDIQEVMTGMTASDNSENTIICHAELVSASRSKNRYSLKYEDPLSAMKSRPWIRSKARSRNKFGMTR
jgi:hypothetical protein